jgi:hypothetical protein
LSLVVGRHVDLQFDGLLSVQFGPPDDRELAVSDLGALETPARSLDALGVGAGSTLLVNGAAGGVGSAA